MPPHRARSHTGFQLQLSSLVLEITQVYRDEETGPEEPRKELAEGSGSRPFPVLVPGKRAEKNESTVYVNE